MNPRLKYLLVLPFVLVSCAKNKPSLSVKEFQKVTDNLEEHQYKTCTLTRSSVIEYFYYSERDYGTDKRTISVNFHYNNEINKWIQDDEGINIIDAYKPQTLHGMDIDNTIDKRYEYNFYTNPLKVHMYRTIDNEETSGYISFDWKYDKYGYLIYIYCHQYLKQANNYNDIKTTYTYVYKE